MIWKTMMVSIIVAMEENRGIGYKGTIPWHISSDLKRLKSLTMGHCLIMGRKTYESIGRPLPGRTSIVITTQKEYTAPGCIVEYEFDRALARAHELGETEVFIFGGSSIYELALPIADRIYLTRVRAEVPSDVYFPTFDYSKWVEISYKEFPQSESDEYSTVYQVLDRTVT